MPLLRRLAFSPSTALPAGLSPGEQVYVVRVTGEVFRDYTYVSCESALASSLHAERELQGVPGAREPLPQTRLDLQLHRSHGPHL